MRPGAGACGGGNARREKKINVVHQRQKKKGIAWKECGWRLGLMGRKTEYRGVCLCEKRTKKNDAGAEVGGGADRDSANSIERRAVRWERGGWGGSEAGEGGGGGRSSRREGASKLQGRGNHRAKCS